MKRRRKPVTREEFVVISERARDALKLAGFPQGEFASTGKYGYYPTEPGWVWNIHRRRHWTSDDDQSPTENLGYFDHAGPNRDAMLEAYAEALTEAEIPVFLGPKQWRSKKLVLYIDVPYKLW